MAQKKQFKDLNLSNAFLFAAALEDPDTCKLVLELILGESVGSVSVKPERSVLFSSDFRCVRFDIFASDEFAVSYDLEMQNTDEKNLPKRSRYHQAEMDVSSLLPGQNFNDLKPSRILFICAFDPFHKGKYRYTFEQRCIEEDFPLDDGTKRIFLSTKGKNAGEVPEALIHFLDYIENSTDAYVNQVDDPMITQLHNRVRTLKRSRELEEHYMWMEEWMQQEINRRVEETLQEIAEEAVQEAEKETVQETEKDALQNVQKYMEHTLQKGLEQGAQRILKLISYMTQAGEADMVSHLGEDEAFCEKMLKKYNL
ncbi:MAG: Rpn family recombination-promoting nuclease/putative transposase [Bacteroides sp.]|nr:Rpn family recombination-promoting nuclease/putative transposase [Bacteroides sp.]MCM1548970.1 Rpn family recombination-promoting nuclease/putative transposase [Clostridium sp.]